MKPKTRAAVLIHGLHLQTPEWEHLVWGENDLQDVGRIPRGIEIAIKEDADLIIWGTGASEDPASKKKESAYTQQFALDHAQELAVYAGVTAEEITALIEQHSLLQLETQNTKDEIREALKVCAEQGINALYLVSSPTHVPRCLLTAIQFQSEFKDVVLYGVAAETSTEYWHPKDVAIVEPSHRPDRDESPFNALAKRMASARKYTDRAPQLYDDIKNLIDAFDTKTKEGAG